MWNLVALLLFASPPDRVAEIAYNFSQTSVPLDQVPVLILQSSTPVLASGGLDPIAAQVTEKHLTTLQKLGYGRTQQGVWIQSQSGQLLASHQATQPLPVASLTKIATTLGSITTWNTESQFLTRIGISGQVVGNTLRGDLIIGGGADPMFVWEDAIKLGNKLQALGIKRIQGDLIVAPGFYMNFETNRAKSANFFRQALNSSAWNDEILTQYQTLPIGTPKPQISIGGIVKLSSQYNAQTLIDHRSLPLWQILKQMNIFSNNIIADVLMQSLGGSTIVSQKLAQLTGVSNSEIRLVNGSGLGQANQISPRAIVALLIATHNQARTQGLSIADLFPMGSCRCGTIQDRYLPSSAVLKTGTLSDVSTLAGVIQTRDRGVVWFALINRGVGDIGSFHQAQEEVLNNLNRTWQELPVWKPKPWQDTDRDQVLVKGF